MTQTATVQAQQRWEYCSMTKWAERAFVNELNVLGQDGWELACALHYTDPKGAMCWTGLLKRPCTGHAPRRVGELETAAAQPAAAKPAQPAAAALQGFDLSQDDFKLESE